MIGHGAPRYVGTNAERVALVTGPLTTGTLWVETDTLIIYMWDGIKWQAFGGQIENTTRIDDTDSPYTILVDDLVVFCDTDGGAITVNLLAGVEGKHHKLINVGTSGNNLTVDGDGAETVYGELTQVLFDGEVIDLHYNVTEGWH